MTRTLKLIGILSCLFIASCISDSRSSCTSLDLYFSYFGDGDTNVFANKVEHVNLLVFDQSQQFVQQLFIESKQIAPTNKYRLTLPAGDFLILAIANNQKEYTEIYFQDNEATLDHLKIQTRTKEEHKAINQSPLYLGCTPIHHELNNTIQQVELNFKNQTHFKLKVEITGLAYTSIDPSELKLIIKNIPQSVWVKGMQNQQQIDILPKLYDTSTALTSDILTLFRPNELAETYIELWHCDQLIQLLSLQQLLAFNQEINWNLQEICIQAQFQFSLLEGIITTADWTIETIQPNFN